MKVISWNVNGVRAVERKKELQPLVENANPEILMLQETKGSVDQLSPFLTAHSGYQQHYSSAEKKGYAGTSIWIKNDFADGTKDLTFSNEIPDAPNSDEGRISCLSFKKGRRKWAIFSIYFPNGGKSDQAWKQKLVFYDCVHKEMNRLREEGVIPVVGGDMNVAHNEIDIARPKANDGKIGFHPKERAWMDRLIDDNWSDVWRSRNPDVADVYSWWHMISKGRERNVGWRIDYFLMPKKNLKLVKDCHYMHEQMGSDHCPISIELES